MTLRYILLLSLIVMATCPCEAAHTPTDKDGFLDHPPVYVNNEPDFPLTGLGVLMPEPGAITPDVDFSGVSSDQFMLNGRNVQHGLDVEVNWIRVGALRGFKGGWAAGLSVPYYRNKVKGAIGGQPATSIAQGFGNIALGGKKIIWQDTDDARVIFAGALELPTGENDAIFGQSNFVTNGYFANSPQRVPLGWQPSAGTFNGLVALCYGRSLKRLSYEGLLAAKIFGAGDEDVKVGSIFIATATGTYGISRDLAGSLGLTLRSQADDSYPNAPAPGVNQPALAGTTTHGATLYLDAGVRYVIMGRVTVGFGVRTPIVKSDTGMVPTTQFSVIFYPSM